MAGNGRRGGCLLGALPHRESRARGAHTNKRPEQVRVAPGARPRVTPAALGDGRSTTVLMSATGGTDRKTLDS
jgi:hypothetical protein